MGQPGALFEWSPQPDASELASKIVSLICISTLAVLLGIKTFNVQYRYLTYSRWLVIILYIFSWSFCTAAIVLISTNNGSYISCFLSIMSCDIFYAGTKLVIYAWLIEKVWIVSAVRGSRLKNTRYRIHLLFMTPYVVILTLMIIFHISELDENGLCIIGLHYIASIPVMCYDFVRFFNLYFTALFLRPLWQHMGGFKFKWHNTRLHDVALRTMAASVVCLFVSLANLLALVILDGRERGVVCLTCCTVDVTINVVTIHWVTSSSTSKLNKEQTGRGSDQTQPVTSDAVNQFHRDSPSAAAVVAAVGSPTTNMDIDAYISRLVSIETNAMGKVAAPTLDHFNYPSHRIVLVGATDGDEEFGVDSRSASISESHSSRQSLTKSSNLIHGATHDDRP